MKRKTRRSRRVRTRSRDHPSLPNHPPRRLHDVFFIRAICLTFWYNRYMQSKNISPEETIPISERINVPAKQLPPHVHKKHDFRESIHWRIFRIMAEFVEGFQFLADLKKTVSFFGSARFSERNMHYQEAVLLSRMLA